MGSNIVFRLNEDWISGYLGIVGGLLAFVIGVSALVMQLALPSYLETLMRRRGMMSYTIAIMLLYLAMALLLVWVSPLSGDGTISLGMTILINVGMSITFIATVLYTYNQLRQINGARIVDSLRRECEIDMRQKGMFDDTLDTLIDIGAQRNAGFEKTRVLTALKELSHFVIRDYPPYDGTLLKPILRGFEEVLVGGGVAGSRDNFSVTAGTLRGIILSLCENEGKYADCADMEEAMRVCSMLASSALTRFTESTAREFLQAVQGADQQDRKTYPLASVALRQIGVAALNEGVFSIGVSTLTMLLQWDDEPFDASDAAEMLGLTAHLWAANKGGAHLTASLMEFHDDRFHPSLMDALDEAIEYHYDSGNFDTHGYLMTMREAALVG